MAVESARSSFDLRSAQLPVVAVVLKDTNIRVLEVELAERLAADPDFFDHDPVLIDLTQVREATDPVDFVALRQVLRSHHTQPVAVRGGSAEQMAAAHAVGLMAAPDAMPARSAAAEVREVVREVIREVEVVREVPAPLSNALVIDRPLRSGQQVYARNTDVVVLGMVSYGAEVIADGNVHVYAPLRGRAVAGARGNTEARIFSTCMEPQLLSIAGVYRAIDSALPADVAGKPAKVRLEGEKIIIESL